MKTSSGKFVATSFLYLTFRRIAGDIPIHLKFALKVTHPFRKRRFWQCRLIVPQPWELARKVQSLLTESRQCRWWALCVTPKPPKKWLKTRILHLALPVISSLRVIVYISNLICGLNIESPSLQMTNRPWNGRAHVTWPILNFQSP